MPFVKLIWQKRNYNTHFQVYIYSNCMFSYSFYDLPDPGLEDMEFSLQELERIKIGEPFNVVVNIKNKSNEERNVKAVLSAGSIFYTGIKAKLVKKAQGEFKMKPNSSKS